MNSKVLIPLIVFLALFVAMIIVLIIINSKRKGKLKKTIEELDYEKNKFILSK